MKKHLIALLGCGSMVLSSCGGGGSSNTASGGTGGTPTPTSGACALSARQDWALGRLEEWYLFPTLLATGVNQSDYSDLQSYIDALVEPARAQSRDRYFTYVTSIAEEDAYYSEGSSAAFGIRLIYDESARQVHVAESFEGSPADGANIGRGAQILAIGTSSSDLQTVSSLMADGGSAAVSDAFGPSEVGVTRVLRITDASAVTREVSITKAEFQIDPVSDRFGTQILTDNGRKVGYLNLRTFIDTADPDLTAAFAEFRDAGVSELIVDLRYNGGGLVWVAELFGDLMGAGRAGQVFDRTTFRDSKASENSVYTFNPQAESIAPTKIAFIGTDGTASASELVINGMVPYLRSEMALVGGNTYGKPVGQIALDRSQCDDRLRVIAFQLENADGQGDYYTGLADTLPVTCRAEDDLEHEMGDPQEEMTARALDFLAGRSCTPIAGSGNITVQSAPIRRDLLRPRIGNTPQREVPGLF